MLYQSSTVTTAQSSQPHQEARGRPVYIHPRPNERIMASGINTSSWPKYHVKHCQWSLALLGSSLWPPQSSSDVPEADELHVEATQTIGRSLL